MLAATDTAMPRASHQRPRRPRRNAASTRPSTVTGNALAIQTGWPAHVATSSMWPYEAAAATRATATMITESSRDPARRWALGSFVLVRTTGLSAAEADSWRVVGWGSRRSAGSSRVLESASRAG